MRGWRQLVFAGILAGALAPAWSQQGGLGIYTCTDEKGRKLTSDRPIAECMDREQKLLNSSGAVRAVVPPNLTARERELREQQERRLAEEKARQAEERRVERALLARYPNPSVHEGERARAVRAIDENMITTQRHIEDLAAQRRKLMEEAEFFKKDPAKYPPKLKRQIEENDQQVAAQQRQLAAQREDKRQVNQRFDEELAKLKVLWNPPAAATGVAAGPTPASGPARMR